MTNALASLLSLHHRHAFCTMQLHSKDQMKLHWLSVTSSTLFFTLLWRDWWVGGNTVCSTSCSEPVLVSPVETCRPGAIVNKATICNILCEWCCDWIWPKWFIKMALEYNSVQHRRKQDTPLLCSLLLKGKMINFHLRLLWQLWPVAPSLITALPQVFVQNQPRVSRF